MAPVSRLSSPKCRARWRAMVLLPAPAGPSMAMIARRHRILSFIRASWSSVLSFRSACRRRSLLQQPLPEDACCAPQLSPSRLACLLHECALQERPCALRVSRCSGWNAQCSRRSRVAGATTRKPSAFRGADRALPVGVPRSPTVRRLRRRLAITGLHSWAAKDSRRRLAAGALGSAGAETGSAEPG